jgi:hypothetical protein
LELDVLHNRLRLHAYKIQLRREIKLPDCPKRVAFADFMLSEIDDNEGCLKWVMFIDEATFYMNSCVSCYNCRIWGSQQLNKLFEYVCGTLKVNIWCGLLHDHVVGPFLWKDALLWTVDIYLHLLEQFFSKVDDIERENATGVVLQQDGTPFHFSLWVIVALNAGFPDRWIGRGGSIAWAPRSHNITTLDFFMWGYVKNIVCAVKLCDLDHLQQSLQL